jgi:hypothetical protein
MEEIDSNRPAVRHWIFSSSRTSTVGFLHKAQGKWQLAKAANQNAQGTWQLAKAANQKASQTTHGLLYGRQRG